MEGIGVVEIAISQNGSVIYSSSENILSPLRKYLQLPFGVSGEYCIEIKGDNGAYAYGCLNYDILLTKNVMLMKRLVYCW